MSVKKIAIPGVDSENGLKLCDGDTGIYLQSLRLFTVNVPETLDKLRNVTENALPDYKVGVHSIKGMSVYIGAEKARTSAKELEDLAKEGDFNGVLAKNEGFIKYIETIIADIKAWLDKNSSSFA